jgi:hypothetical protein
MLKSTIIVATAVPVLSSRLGAAAMEPFASPKPGVAVEHV